MRQSGRGRKLRLHWVLYHGSERHGDVWQRSYEEHCEYAYSEQQLRGYLKAAGFTHVEVYADRKFEAPAAGEQRIYFKARKGRIK